MPNPLFAVKPLDLLLREAQETGERSLKRSLGPYQLVALGVGAVIGAGIFTLTGVAAATRAGPALVISFVFAAIGCAFAGLCYSEFSTMIPIAGSAYTCSYATSGELLACIIGWDLVLEYAVGAATVSIGWSGTLVSLLHHFNIHLPPALVASPWQPVQLADGTIIHGIFNLPAVFIVAMISLVLVKGIEESSWVNTVIVFLKVTVLVIFIAIGWKYIQPANLTPLLPKNTTGEFGAFGWSGILAGAGTICFAYIGFDAVSTAAQEARNPKRDMPIGIFGSLVVCTLLYVLFSYVLSGVATVEDFRSSGREASVAFAITKYMTGYEWLSKSVTVAILAGFSSVILVMLLGQSRVFFSMSRAGLVPRVFSDGHPRYRTPWNSNMLFFVFTGLLAG